MGWKFDAGNSYVYMSSVHYGVALGRARFNQVDVTLDLEGAGPTGWSATATMQTASIDSNHQRRDEDLRGPDYLDAERSPTITFQSRRVERNGDAYRAVGDLTFRGVTREVAMDLRYNGEVKDPRGRPRRGFTASTTIKRSDFGTDVRNQTFADEVQVTMDVQAVLEDG